MSRFFGAPMQTALVVRNIDEHIQRCLDGGIGPFYVDKLTLHTRYRGVRYDAPVTVAFAYSGSMMYEYLEPHDDTPSPYNDFLAKNPEGGLHHLAYFCDDYDQALALAKSRGGEYDVALELLTAEGNLIEIYLEPKNHPDAIMTQLIDQSRLGDMFTKMEAAAAEWDGTNPVRSFVDFLPPAIQPQA